MGKLVLKIGAGVIALVLVVVVGGWLMLRRADIPYATLEQRWAAPGSRYVDLPGGVRVHYLDQGNPKGPTLLLVHGFSMSTDTWAAWTRRLGKDYRVVSLDLPGFGLTRAPIDWPYGSQTAAGIVEAFAKAKGLDRFVIAGSSMGGGVAWRYALGHPERVRGLILVDSAGWPEPGDPFAGNPLVSAASSPVFGPILLQMPVKRTLDEGIRGAWADPSKVDAAYLKRYEDMALAPGRRKIWLGLVTHESKTDVATPERLGMIRAPTLILWGDKDALIPVSDSKRFAAAIPGSHLIVYRGVGHLPHEEAADRSAADVSTFMRALDAGAVKKAALLSGLGKAAPVEAPKAPTSSQKIFY